MITSNIPCINIKEYKAACMIIFNGEHTDTPYNRSQFPVKVHSKLFATGWADEKLVKMKNGVTDIPNKPQKP